VRGARSATLTIDHFDEANRLNAGHDRLAQITAELIPATLLAATVPGMPLLEPMRARLSGQRRLQNLRNRHRTKSYYYSSAVRFSEGDFAK
jgi:hypothetical protein